jgi:hypothetical protein
MSLFDWSSETIPILVAPTVLIDCIVLSCMSLADMQPTSLVSRYHYVFGYDRQFSPKAGKRCNFTGTLSGITQML